MPAEARFPCQGAVAKLLQQDAERGTLVPLTRSKMLPLSSLGDAQMPERGVARALGEGCLQRDTRVLGVLFQLNELLSAGPGDRIGDGAKRLAARCKAGANERALGRGRAGSKHGREMSALGSMGRGKDLAFGGVGADQRGARGVDSIAIGLPVFGGALARPFQRSGYRSRSFRRLSRSVQ